MSEAYFAATLLSAAPTPSIGDLRSARSTNGSHSRQSKSATNSDDDIDDGWDMLEDTAHKHKPSDQPKPASAPTTPPNSTNNSKIEEGEPDNGNSASRPAANTAGGSFKSLVYCALYNMYHSPPTEPPTFTDSPIWVLGQNFSLTTEELLANMRERHPANQSKKGKSKKRQEHAERFMAEFANIIYFSYRKEFPKLNYFNTNTDVGWGCMLRTGQMMLARALTLCDPLAPIASTGPYTLDRRILKLFADHPDDQYRYSIHHIVDRNVAIFGIDKKDEEKNGIWFSPSKIAKVLRYLVKHSSMDNLTMYVPADSVICVDRVLSLCTREEKLLISPPNASLSVSSSSIANPLASSMSVPPNTKSPLSVSSSHIAAPPKLKFLVSKTAIPPRRRPLALHVNPTMTHSPFDSDSVRQMVQTSWVEIDAPPAPAQAAVANLSASVLHSDSEDSAAVDHDHPEQPSDFDLSFVMMSTTGKSPPNGTPSIPPPALGSNSEDFVMLDSTLRLSDGKSHSPAAAAIDDSAVPRLQPPPSGQLLESFSMTDVNANSGPPSPTASELEDEFQWYSAHSTASASAPSATAPAAKTRPGHVPSAKRALPAKAPSPAVPLQPLTNARASELTGPTPFWSIKFLPPRSELSDASISSLSPTRPVEVYEFGSQAHPNAGPTWRPILIIIPMRLGVHKINPAYLPQLKAIFRSKYCIGVVGGKPKQSLYFVGYQDEDVFFLDPHYVRSATKPDDAWTPDVYQSYHMKIPQRMPLANLDPSMAVGFLCRSLEEFEDFCNFHSEMILEEGGEPMFTIQRTSPTHKASAHRKEDNHLLIVDNA